MERNKLYSELEAAYRRYNHRRFVHPDPLELLYDYPKLQDREIAGLVAACLAYGNVRQILKSAEEVLRLLGPSPRKFLLAQKPERLRKSLAGFRHRFTDGQEMSSLLIGIKNVISKYGSLGAALQADSAGAKAGVKPKAAPGRVSSLPLFGGEAGLKSAGTAGGTVAVKLAEIIRAEAGGGVDTLIPRPECKSAFKRLNLYLRWMVRRDEVDPGGWEIPASALVVPLDTHMRSVALSLGLTSRKQADMKTALEITRRFAEFSPDDPVKYDFCLTRAGIRATAGIAEGE